MPISFPPFLFRLNRFIILLLPLSFYFFRIWTGRRFFLTSYNFFSHKFLVGSVIYDDSTTIIGTHCRNCKIVSQNSIGDCVLIINTTDKPRPRTILLPCLVPHPIISFSDWATGIKCRFKYTNLSFFFASFFKRSFRRLDLQSNPIYSPATHRMR